jgi:DNA mismatch endonuclease, patch repair protein
VDHLTPEYRSRLMSRVRSKDTRPELVVRKLVYSMGFRYRLHRADLPGRPDLVFASRRRIIFVNGCFWHRHEGCKRASFPKSRTEFWKNKFEANVARDRRVNRELCDDGWNVLTIWECETFKPLELSGKLQAFLDGLSGEQYSKDPIQCSIHTDGQFL